MKRTRTVPVLMTTIETPHRFAVLLALVLALFLVMSFSEAGSFLPGTPEANASEEPSPWRPDPGSQELIAAAAPGSVLIFVQNEEDGAPRLMGESGAVEGLEVEAEGASQAAPGALGCLMSINTPQNVEPGRLTHRAVITCTNTMTYIRGTVCPEFFRNSVWTRQNDVCQSGTTTLRSGLTVERAVVCANGTSYRTWGELRVDYINQTATDSGTGSASACVF